MFITISRGNLVYEPRKGRNNIPSSAALYGYAFTLEGLVKNARCDSFPADGKFACNSEERLLRKKERKKEKEKEKKNSDCSWVLVPREEPFAIIAKLV